MGDRFPSVTMYFNGIQFDAVANARCVLGLSATNKQRKPICTSDSENHLMGTGYTLNASI